MRVNANNSVFTLFSKFFKEIGRPVTRKEEELEPYETCPQNFNEPNCNMHEYTIG
jgi:hypothetical protein